MALLTLFGFASCGDDDDKTPETSDKENELQAINTSYLSQVIRPIYKSLADETIQLRKALETLQESKTEANLADVCRLWFSSRRYWEWSEAFLYGPADEYEIDPHIDTWPADIPEIQSTLNNESKLNNIQQFIYDNQSGLAGFHGLEYILFRNGSPRAAADLTANEVRFAVGVAKDLALSCCRLEICWSGAGNVTQEKRTILSDFGIDDDLDTFGDRLIDGYDGKGNIQSSTIQILEGFITIVDEVGGGKIGTAHNGEDVSYIESPHAYNSIQDFEDNIQGVKFGYLGGVNATSARTSSVAAYIRQINPDLDRRITDAIAQCIARIQAMPKPFALHFTDPKCGDAIDACDALTKAFQEAERAIEQQD
jgi:hypothetical protein